MALTSVELAPKAIRASVPHGYDEGTFFTDVRCVSIAISLKNTKNVGVRFFVVANVVSKVLLCLIAN